MQTHERKKRRTRITVETERVLIIRGGNSESDGWCGQCGARVKLLAPETAAALTGLGRRALYRLVETGQVHFTESRDAIVSICLESLTTVSRVDGLHRFQSKEGE